MDENMITIMKIACTKSALEQRVKRREGSGRAAGEVGKKSGGINKRTEARAQAQAGTLIVIEIDAKSYRLPRMHENKQRCATRVRLTHFFSMFRQNGSLADSGALFLAYVIFFMKYL